MACPSGGFGGLFCRSLKVLNSSLGGVTTRKIVRYLHEPKLSWFVSKRIRYYEFFEFYPEENVNLKKL